MLLARRLGFAVLISIGCAAAPATQGSGGTAGTGGSGGVGGTGTGSNQPLTVYGRVASQATPSPGTCTDSVIVTVTY